MSYTKLSNVVQSVFIAAILLTLNSCCTKKDCIGSDDMDYILFENFAQDDLDTIVIKRYNKNTNFLSPLDSFVTITEYFSMYPDEETIHLTDRLTVFFDYNVILVSTGQSFKISDFAVKKERCNTGFLCVDHFNALDSYQVNGQVQHGSLFINN